MSNHESVTGRTRERAAAFRSARLSQSWLVSWEWADIVTAGLFGLFTLALGGIESWWKDLWVPILATAAALLVIHFVLRPAYRYIWVTPLEKHLGLWAQIDDLQGELRAARAEVTRLHAEKDALKPLEVSRDRMRIGYHRESDRWFLIFQEVTLRNPNDFPVDVIASLELIFRGLPVRHAAITVPWQAIFTDAHPDRLPPQIGPGVFSVDARRARVGYAYFDLTVMTEDMIRQTDEAFLDFRLVCEAANEPSVRGVSQFMQNKRLILDALPDRPPRFFVLRPAPPPNASPSGDSDES